MLNFYYPVNNKLGIMFLPFLHTQKSFSFIWLFLYWLFDKKVSLESPERPGPERAGRGMVGFGWKEFMEKVKPEVSRIIRDNRLTKIKIILSCEIVRENENGSGQL